MGETARRRTCGNWVLGSQLGRGSFAVVWKGQHRTSGAVVAVKEICTNQLNAKLKQSLECEVSILKRVEHRNIVRLLETLELPERSRMYLVMEYCAGGDLAHYIRRCKRVPEVTARGLMLQLAAGLREMWSHNLVHRDLKPQNLLLSDNSPGAVLKIADFGFARNLQPQGLAETLCGSPLYMAPEILQFHKYDAKADLWSVGTILYELLIGRPPFNGDNHVQLLHNIERQKVQIPADVAAQLSMSCRRLLAGLLKRNPVERMSFEEFFSHPWLNAAGDPAVPLAAAAASDATTVERSGGSGSSLRHPAGSSNASTRLVAGGSSNASTGLVEDLPFMVEREEGGGSTGASRAVPMSGGQRHHKHPSLMSSSRLDAIIAPMTPSTTDSHAHLGSHGSSTGMARRGGTAASSGADTMDEDDYVIIESSAIGARAAAAAYQQPPSPGSLAALRRRGLAAMWHPLSQSPSASPAATPPSPRMPPRPRSPSPCTAPAPSAAQQAASSGVAAQPSLLRPPSSDSALFGVDGAPPVLLSVVRSMPEALEQVAGALESLAGAATRADQPARSLALRLLSLQLLQLALAELQQLASQRKQLPQQSSQRADFSAQSSQQARKDALPPAQHSSARASAVGKPGGSSSSAPAAPALVLRLTAQLKAISDQAQRNAAMLARSGCHDLPDAWEAAYEGGLQLSQAAAAEELLGNWAAASHAYAKAAAVMHFMAGNACGLQLQPPLSLEPPQLGRVQRYAAAIAARLTAATAHICVAPTAIATCPTAGVARTS